MQLSDGDLRTILGYLRDDRSQMLPKGLSYRPISVTYLRRARIADLPEQAQEGLEETLRENIVDGRIDYVAFFTAGVIHLAKHPEYIDELIQ